MTSSGTAVAAAIDSGTLPLKALSLAIAQTCNLGCTYCYAEQGSFGGPSRSMTLEVARGAVDRLIADAEPGSRVCVAFMGGEPLMNRPVLRAATRYAAERAATAGLRLSFALTTNGTLVTEADADFFEAYAFTITLSVDGPRDSHNLLRPFRNGRDSYDRVLAAARCLLRRSDRRSRTIARVTVTPRNLHLARTFDALRDAGFDAIQFSPVLRSPSGADQLNDDDLHTLLAQMIECGEIFARRLVAGESYPFLNAIGTLRRIHLRQRDAYPCGAGGGYMGVSATGGLYACHRFVGDEARAMGDIAHGIDRAAQKRWIALRHVDAQTPCQTCWARDLCSGGCHYEDIHAGRFACDYIRGWLRACLGLYAELRREHLDLLTRAFGVLPAVE